jgi:hypothetical protein
MRSPGSHSPGCQRVLWVLWRQRDNRNVRLRVIRLAFVVGLAGLAAGCAKTHARTEPVQPALEPPPSPPRVIVPAEPEQPSEAPQPGPTAQARPVSRPRTSGRSDSSKSDAPGSPDVKKPDSAPEVPGNPSRQGSAQLGALQMVRPGDQGELERAIRDRLTRASRDLGRVDYAALSADAKAQYDTAKRFVQQAEQALKERNFIFAAKLADKAETLSAILVAR